MARKSVVEKVKAMKWGPNMRYNIGTSEILEIHRDSGGTYEALYNCFQYGYMQGMKAAKAEAKRKQAD